jgi:cytochrome bd-type quinol oxidase subunit 2
MGIDDRRRANVLDLTHPHTAAAFRTIRRLLLAYLVVSVAALVAIVAMRNDAGEVNSAVWTRAIIVAVSAALMLLFATRAAEGSRGAYRRLRIISIVTVVAIAAIIASPGTFPVWLKVEQGLCGLIMAGVAVVAHQPRLRALFAAPPAGE